MEKEGEMVEEEWEEKEEVERLEEMSENVSDRKLHLHSSEVE